jgi:hypothetical protein
MLPPALTECPRCHANLEQPGAGIGNKDILRLTGLILGLVLIPLIIILGIGMLCTLAFS